MFYTNYESLGFNTIPKISVTCNGKERGVGVGGEGPISFSLHDSNIINYLYSLVREALKNMNYRALDVHIKHRPVAANRRAYVEWVAIFDKM